MSGEPQVIIIDDHPLVGEPLTTALEPPLQEHGFAVLPSVRSVAEVPRIETPGVAICDVRLRAGGPSGAAAVRRLTSLGWHVLLFSGEAQPGQVLDAIAAGALGYIEKSVAPDALIEPVVVAARGGHHLSLELARLLYADLHRRELPQRDELGASDRELLKAFAAGERAERIAGRRGMTDDELRLALARVFAAATRRRELFALTEREIEVAKAFGCGRAHDAADVAALLRMGKHTVNDHLKSLRDKYVKSHPAADGRHPKQQAAARLWAAELGLCAEDGPESGPLQ
jgi:DNA-binding NarL/FixJ family response regulator